MASKVTSLAMWFHVEVNAAEPYLLINYTPLTDAPHPNSQLEDYNTQFKTEFVNLLPDLRAKLTRLIDYCFGTLEVPEIDLGDIQGRGTIAPGYLQVQDRNGLQIDLSYLVNGVSTGRPAPVSEAAERLIRNIWPMCEQMAWNHLRNRLGGMAKPTTVKKTIFLSYRKKSDSCRRFVEAIAHRLGKEGFLPWFDGWEIMAGDSLAREMADGLQNAYAIITILTADYPGSRWAREELENAITQRVERNIKIIPVLFEPCERPALLQTLAYVDCTAHDPNQFENQFLRIIDALNEIDLNPYR